jgi:hypothetical protein
MEQMQVTQVSSQLFSHFPQTCRLVAEISDLGIQGFDRLYTDAQDRGVELVNHKTGTRTRWAVGRTMQRDGEVLGWCLFPTPETVRQSPAVEHYCMTLIND